MTEEGRLLDSVVPLFFVLIALEWWYAPQYYRLNDALSSLTQGALSSLANLLWASTLMLPYVWLRGLLVDTGLALDLSSSWSGLCILALGVDLSYYWGHRASHMMSLCWAGHGVHHSSEEYNLTTALRQSAFFEKFFSTAFRLYLCFLCDYDTYLLIFELNLLYQFWVHTSTIAKLPWWFEAVFVTPSHHRVHHARNPRYIDKNFGGNLIIWDKLFGTFESEDEVCVYGLVHPLQTFDPLVAQFSHLSAVITQAMRADGLLNKLRVCFRPPGYDFKLNVVPPFPEIDTKKPKYDPKIPARAQIWVVLTFLLLLGASLHFMKLSRTLPVGTVAALTLVLAHNYRNINLVRISLSQDYFRIALNAGALWWLVGVPFLHVSFFSGFSLFLLHWARGSAHLQ